MTDANDQAASGPPEKPPAPAPLRLAVQPRRTWRAWRQRVLVFVTTALALTATVLLSPILLLTVHGVFSTDWTILSEVGQSYTGISTLFSVAALLGAVLTIRLQIRQSQVAQEHALRDTQFQLLSLALQDPDLMAATSLTTPEHSDAAMKRRHIFLTMSLRHLQFLHLTKDLPETTLEAMLRSEFFDNDQARQHWARVRQNWAAGADGRQEVGFVATADRVWRSYGGT